MKNYILAIALFTAGLTLHSCTKHCEKPDPLTNNNNNTNTGCIDTSKIDPNGACYKIYDPVCGCDGKTYGNDCEAKKAGVISFVKGACGSETGK